LRKFAVRKSLARQRFAGFIAAGAKLGTQEHFYAENNILGSEEFIDETIHRIGEFDTRAAALRRTARPPSGEINTAALIAAVEKFCEVPAAEFCTTGKSARVVRAKEALIIAGRHLGATINDLTRITGLSSASISRRYDAARSMKPDHELHEIAHQVIIEYGGQ
jgi:hypothetical protein